jgi:NAD(P)-dependent dehydrogenase (short-subunit alcohol dehydrogenase family)
VNVNFPLKGRNAIITGGNQGLGLAIAQAYLQSGANLFLCARNGELLEQVRDDLSRQATPGQIVTTLDADISKLSEVEKVFARAQSIFPQIHILVNNAGVYGPLGKIEEVDWADWVKAVEINLLGSVLMCRAVVPHFRKNGYGKIIQISGGGATNPLPRISAYAASKAAIVRFTETLAEETRPDHIDVNAIAPGALNTRLLDEVLAAGPEKVGAGFYEKSRKQKSQGGTPLIRGAQLSVFLGSAASDGITGKLISAVWDPWEELPSHLNDLQESDIYTLRRIVPKDRNLNWGDQ